MKLSSFLNVFRCFVSEAGSEQSTNFRGWDFRAFTHTLPRGGFELVGGEWQLPRD